VVDDYLIDLAAVTGHGGEEVDPLCLRMRSGSCWSGLAVHHSRQWLRLLARLSVMEPSCRAGADEGSRRRHGDSRVCARLPGKGRCPEPLDGAARKLKLHAVPARGPGQRRRLRPPP
jgi:hypothetical protein